VQKNCVKLFECQSSIRECESFFKDCRDQKVIDELEQLVAALKICEHEKTLDFPLSVYKNPDKFPDFLLKFRDSTIGVEVTFVTTSELEKARKLQLKYNENPGDNPPLDIMRSSLLYRKRHKSRKPGEIMAAAFLIAGESYGRSVESVQQDWKDSVRESLHKKVGKFKSGEIVQCKEYWLVLWDCMMPRMGSDWKRAELINLCKECNGASRFSRVILLSKDFSRRIQVPD